MAEPEKTDPLIEFASFVVDPKYQYFVHGFVEPRALFLSFQVPGPSDFGAGYYVFEATPRGISLAAEWARKKAYRNGGTARVELSRIETAVMGSLSNLQLRPSGQLDRLQWDQVVGWHRQTTPAWPGPADVFDWVSGPLATGSRPYLPLLRLPDQFRFLRRNLGLLDVFTTADV